MSQSFFGAVTFETAPLPAARHVRAENRRAFTSVRSTGKSRLKVSAASSESSSFHCQRRPIEKACVAPSIARAKLEAVRLRFSVVFTHHDSRERPRHKCLIRSGFQGREISCFSWPNRSIQSSRLGTFPEMGHRHSTLLGQSDRVCLPRAQTFGISARDSKVRV